MKDDTFDRALRHALVDAQREDRAQILRGEAADLPEPAFSAGYCRRRERLLKNPFGYARRTARPVWRTALRAAACVLLTLCLTTMMLWLNPSTRAWVERYVFQRFENHDEYTFNGEVGDASGLGGVAPAWLPEGFQQTEQIDFDFSADFTYENAEGQVIYYSQMLEKQGSELKFDNEHATRSDILVNDLGGQLYTASDPEYFNYLLLFDQEKKYIYLFTSTIDTDTLVKMAESLETGN